MPEPIEYLRDWIHELHGRSGASMNGLAPLSWPTVHAWRKSTGRRPDPAEVEALFALDAVLCNPDIVPEGESE